MTIRALRLLAVVVILTVGAPATTDACASGHVRTPSAGAKARHATKNPSTKNKRKADADDSLVLNVS